MDDRLRKLERAAEQGDEEDFQRLLAECVRSGRWTIVRRSRYSVPMDVAAQFGIPELLMPEIRFGRPVMRYVVTSVTTLGRRTINVIPLGKQQCYTVMADVISGAGYTIDYRMLGDRYFETKKAATAAAKKAKKAEEKRLETAAQYPRYEDIRVEKDVYEVYVYWFD